MTNRLLLILALAACGGGDDDGGMTPDAGTGSSSANCSATVSVTPNKSNRTILGTGDIQCDAAANLSAEVCVQWNSSGSFTDIMCMSADKSGVTTLSVSNVSSCGLGTGKKFRVRLNATVNGSAKPEMLSSEVGCE